MARLDIRVKLSAGRVVEAEVVKMNKRTVVVKLRDGAIVTLKKARIV